MGYVICVECVVAAVWEPYGVGYRLSASPSAGMLTECQLTFAPTRTPTSPQLRGVGVREMEFLSYIYLLFLSFSPMEDSHVISSCLISKCCNFGLNLRIGTRYLNIGIS